LSQNENVVNSASQNRRANIIVIDKKKNQGFIFDPTIQWETNVLTQDKNANKEKQAIYVPCIPDW